MNYSLHTPLSEELVRRLKIGDHINLSGIIFTARDMVHKHLAKVEYLPAELNLEDSVIYHCGPVIIKDALNKWKVVAAGPTTSIRHEPYQATVIKRFKLRAIIGKGGMGDKTLQACKEFGCVYLQAIGGAAQIYAERIIKVEGVYFLDIFGPTEAMWKLQVKEFPLIVSMDSHGNSLHSLIETYSHRALHQLLK